MEPGEVIQQTLYKEHLSYQWLAAQLNARGLSVGKTAISLALTGKRDDDTSKRILRESEKVLENYNRFLKGNGCKR